MRSWSKRVPLYEYECEACGERFELIRKFSDPAVDVCARCGRGPVHRLPSSPAIQFKGTGWYITDYAQKGKSDKSGPAPGSDAKTDSPSTTDSSTKTGADSSSSKGEGTASPPATASGSSKD
jgi:putative FmdB family regulatory protein